MTEKRLRVAIIGAGPAGLSAAIEFQRLPFVDLRIYEQATVLREIGSGLSLQRNTWRMLESLGALQHNKPEEMFRAANRHSVQHRNGRTGELSVSHAQGDTPSHHLHARVFRSVLQKALLQTLDQEKTTIQLSSRLQHITQYTPTGPLTLHFSNGHTNEVDLVIGADAYRGLIPTEKIPAIPGFPDAVTFWHGPRDWVYTCNLRHGVYELTCNADVPNDGGRVSWGEEASLEEFRRPWKDFGPLVQQIIGLATDVQRFALFAGPRLESVVSRDSIALIGDASHPLSGAFGNGAGFALEDSYVLARAVEWAYERGHTLSRGLDLYDRVRSPHYQAMYAILDAFKKSDAELGRSNLSFDEGTAHTIRGKWGREYGWLYDYDVQGVWQKAAREEDVRLQQEVARL
ncbi:hypothetical protein ASPCAL09438 [Aspergillus calidoustus]|uniref:FAD-binding domain-containing protein n=1 Tax=Aspergillus calidoustus TaxID=454130 RepID=A0A0U5A3X1_ASPCI|nr:hypothetical protein ASPCAL09438 [Aspergillus calidoustus]